MPCTDIPPNIELTRDRPDIDGIKIRSDVEGGASKRSYNYRVRYKRIAHEHVILTALLHTRL